MIIEVRKPEEIYQAAGQIHNGTFSGRWHFSFDEYYDPEYMQFGALRVFNDDTLSPGAVWPLHPHRNIEVVTYCVEGEFMHMDDGGLGSLLEKGWVQHTTVGRGMRHSEINNLPDKPMRFIQMWFVPSTLDLQPSVEKRKLTQAERRNRLLPLVSNEYPGALPINADAQVYASFLQKGHSINYDLIDIRGVYLYVIEGGPVRVAGQIVEPLGAAQIVGETTITISADTDAELLLVDTKMI